VTATTAQWCRCVRGWLVRLIGCALQWSHVVSCGHVLGEKLTA